MSFFNFTANKERKLRDDMNQLVDEKSKAVELEFGAALNSINEKLGALLVSQEALRLETKARAERTDIRMD
jgi:hypothetical protein